MPSANSTLECPDLGWRNTHSRLSVTAYLTHFQLPISYLGI